MGESSFRCRPREGGAHPQLGRRRFGGRTRDSRLALKPIPEHNLAELPAIDKEFPLTVEAIR